MRGYMARVLVRLVYIARVYGSFLGQRVRLPVIFFIICVRLPVIDFIICVLLPVIFFMMCVSSVMICVCLPGRQRVNLGSNPLGAVSAEALAAALENGKAQVR